MKTISLILSLVLFLANAHATNRTWDGSSSGYWGTAANWTPSGIPGNGDILTFPGGTPHPTMTNNVPNLNLNQIYFTGNSTPKIEGDQITVTNGIFSNQSSGFSYVNMSSILADSSVFPNPIYGVGNGGSSTASLVLQNQIRLNNHNLTLLATDTNAIIFVEGPIQETGNVIIQGPGTTRFFDVNTYTGTTTVQSGALELGTVGGIAIPGDLIIGDGSGGADADVVRLLAASEIGNVAVTVNSSGLLDLNGYNDGFDTLILNNGNVTTGAGKVSFHSLTSSGGGVNAPTIFGGVNLGTIMVPFDVTNGNLVIFAAISGTGGVIKNGSGELDLAGTNTYSGPTIVNSGLLEVDSVSSPGSTGSGTTLNGGALLFLGSVAGESLTNNSSSAQLQGANSAAWSGSILLNSNLNVLTPFSDTMALAGSISGSGGIITSHAGTITLSGSTDNTFSGSTIATGTLLNLGKSLNAQAVGGPLFIGGGPLPVCEVRWANTGQLPTPANVTLYTNGLASLAGFNDTITSLTFNGGHVNLGTAGGLSLSGSVTVNPTNATALIDGALVSGGVFLSAGVTFNVGNGSASTDLQIDSRINGPLGFDKTGAGKMTLTGNSTFTGTAVVKQGILFADSDNALGSSSAGTVVSNGATLWLGINASIVPEPLTLNGNGVGGTNGALDGTSAVTASGAISLASASTIRAEAGSQFHISGVVGGTGSLTKNGGGSLFFSGASANTYTGDTFVNDGFLFLNKPSNVMAVPGQLVISGATVRYFAGNNAVNGPVIVNQGGLYDLNGWSEDFGSIGSTPITLNGGGDVQTGAGLLTLPAGTTITVEPFANGTSTISGRLGLAASIFGGSHTFAVSAPFSLFAGTPLTVSASLEAISSTANVFKTGNGEMRLSGNNTFTGKLIVNDGQVTLASSTALGAGGGVSGAVVNSNAVLAIDGSLNLVGSPLTLNSTSAVPFTVLSGSSIWNSTTALAKDSTIKVATNAALVLAGSISGAGDLTKIGPGTLVFGGPATNTYGSQTFVNEGTLVLSNSAVVNQTITTTLNIGDGLGGVNADVVRLAGNFQIADDVPVTITSSGLLDLNANSDVVGLIAGSGNITLGSGTLTVSNQVNVGHFSGVISGSGSVVKKGAGTLTFEGNNTYAGSTTVSGGTLTVNGTQPQSAVTVNNAGTLNGSGTVGKLNVNSGGIVTPGNSPGILTCSNLTLLAGSTVTVELNGLTPGSGHDQVNVSGSVTLGGAVLNASLGFASAISNSFTIINNDGAEAVTNTFSGLTNGATFNISGIPFKISYTGGTGNDVVLTQLLGLPTLTALRSANTNLVFSWPTNYTGFTLESNTNLSSAVWTTVVPAPVVSGINYVVTNSMTSPQKFFRLRSP